MVPTSATFAAPSRSGDRVLARDLFISPMTLRASGASSRRRSPSGPRLQARYRGACTDVRIAFSNVSRTSRAAQSLAPFSLTFSTQLAHERNNSPPRAISFDLLGRALPRHDKTRQWSYRPKNWAGPPRRGTPESWFTASRPELATNRKPAAFVTSARLESPPAPPRRGACSVRGLAQPLGHGTHTNRLSGGLLDPLPASGRACILSGIPHGGFRHETPDWISCRCAAGNRLRHRNPKACQRRHLLHIRGLSCRLHRKGRCRAPPAPGCAGSCARSGAAWNADELWWSRQPRGPALKALVRGYPSWQRITEMADQAGLRRIGFAFSVIVAIVAMFAAATVSASKGVP